MRWLRQSGFTLLEILLVMALVALLAAIVSPTLLRSEARVFNEAVQQAHLALKRARTEAVMERRDRRVRFQRSEEPVAGVRVWAQPGIEVALRRSADQAPLQPPEVTFFPDGTSSGGTLEFRSGGMQQRILVSPESGHIAFATPE